MRLTAGQILIASLAASAAGTVIIFPAVVIFAWGEIPPLVFLIPSAVLALFAWPFCWIGLAITSLLLTKAQVDDWWWAYAPATAIGALGGLLIGTSLFLATGVAWWIGLPYGAASGLLAAVMDQRSVIRSG